ncbi:pilus assembly protein FlpE [Krasilnikoviella flava]|uniref:Helicase/secretion neighborhood CpaE-like protein n=1 Tax=Krasilnikoviella flava TaxID=526729 RepID=A0A1T5LGR0_9MICO|nr:pilus assembly protein FlpE [Krasilnikoviella flava]SKC75183.1 helicase/secretion neighborhood CpaE-like protein [Krasilnikoviella flava]
MDDALTRILPRPTAPALGATTVADLPAGAGPPERDAAPWRPAGRAPWASARGRRTIALVGACGGAGVSILAAAVAQGLRRAGEGAVLVDLDLPGPGADVLLGIEDEPGARWPELAAARGDVDGVGLVAALPRWRSVPVLSGARLRPERPDDAVVVDVATGLLRGGESVVLDLPRPAAWTAAVRMLVSAADVVLLVVPCTATGVAGALAARAELVELGVRDPWLVARRPAPGRIDAAALEDVVGLRVVTTVRADTRLAAAVDRGDGPPVGRRSPLGRAVDPLVTALAGAA